MRRRRRCLPTAPNWRSMSSRHLPQVSTALITSRSRTQQALWRMLRTLATAATTMRATAFVGNTAKLLRNGQRAVAPQQRPLTCTPFCMGRCAQGLWARQGSAAGFSACTEALQTCACGHPLEGWRRRRRQAETLELPPAPKRAHRCRRSAKIAVRKGKADAQKSKLYGKIGKQIAQAVRQGGPDALANSRLKDALAAAKAAQVRCADFWDRQRACFSWQAFRTRKDSLCGVRGNNSKLRGGGGGGGVCGWCVCVCGCGGGGGLLTHACLNHVSSRPRQLTCMQFAPLATRCPSTSSIATSSGPLSPRQTMRKSRELWRWARGQHCGAPRSVAALRAAAPRWQPSHAYLPPPPPPPTPSPPPHHPPPPPPPAHSAHPSSYEAYGVGGTGFVIECLTDNVNRSASDVKAAITKGGGKVGGWVLLCSSVALCMCRSQARCCSGQMKQL